MERVLSHSPLLARICLIGAFVVLSTLLPASVCCSASPRVVRTIIVNGEGSTKDKALKNAWRNAVETTMGGYVASETRVKNYQLISDKILSFSEGYIENFEVLEERRLKGRFWIKMKATVKQGLLLTTLKRHNIDIEGENLYATLMTHKENKKTRAKVCKQELSRWKYPDDFATVTCDHIEILPNTISYGKKEYAEVALKGIIVRVVRDRMQILKGWMDESLVTKNKHISEAIVKLYGHPPPGVPKLHGYKSKSPNAYFHYNPGPGPRVWAPVVALQCINKDDKVLYQTTHYYSTECPNVKVTNWLMDDTNIRSHIYRVPVHILRKTTKAQPVVVASGLHPYH